MDKVWGLRRGLGASPRGFRAVQIRSSNLSPKGMACQEFTDCIEHMPTYSIAYYHRGLCKMAEKLKTTIVVLKISTKPLNTIPNILMHMLAELDIMRKMNNIKNLSVIVNQLLLWSQLALELIFSEEYVTANQAKVQRRQQTSQKQSFSIKQAHMHSSNVPLPIITLEKSIMQSRISASLYSQKKIIIRIKTELGISKSWSI